jgi:DNA-binding NarL/FixJ family response regulator
MNEPIKYIIADDHNIMLEGLKNLMANDTFFNLCGTYNTYHSALAGILKHKPDLMLTDISFPDGNGIDLFKYVRVHLPHIKSVCLTMHKEKSYINKAFVAGMHGYLPKETGIDEIKYVMKGVLNGQTFFDAKLLELSDELCQYNQLKEKLSQREIEIIRLISDGMSTKQIADSICLSPFTIETHRKNINSKLNVKNVGELLKVARQENIID